MVLDVHSALAEAYRQNWERLVHVDRQRMFFTNFYAAIVGGLLAFLASQKIWLSEWSPWVFGFLFLLSLFGFFLNRRINGHVDAYERMLNRLAQRMNISEFYTRGAPETAKITLRRLYKYLYLAGMIAFVVLLAIAVWRSSN